MMQEQKTIKVTIDQLGNPKVEAIGFNGIGCAAATEAIEKALAPGSGGVTREMKPEWHQSEEEGEHEGVRW